MNTSISLPVKGTSLTLYYVNATSLAKVHAIQHLHSDIITHNANVALIAETWFTNRHLDTDISIDGFDLFRRDRSKRKGGGVCAYVNDQLDCERFKPCDNGYLIEIIWLKIAVDSCQFFIACVYHPPKPSYSPHELLDELLVGVDVVTNSYPNSVVVIVGDFNQLDTTSLEVDYGLVQLVSSPTHNQNLIDKVFTNRPDMFITSCFKSVVKTKHMAILIAPPGVRNTCHSNRFTVTLYDLRAHNIDRIRNAFGVFDWSAVTTLYNTDAAYDLFLSVVRYFIDQCVPHRQVRLSHKDPPYFTPLVKSLLRKRNRFRRAGRLAEAAELADKINRLIAEIQGRSLARLTEATPKQLWAAVKPNRHNSRAGAELLIDADAVNAFFANIATDIYYTVDNVIRFKQDIGTDQGQYTDEYVTCYQVERMLRTLKSTAPGYDMLPSWLFRSCSYELASPIAHIYNCSIHSGSVPNPWRTALVTPVPKIPHPVSLSDFRPISVTPILSRVAEKFIVKHFVQPAIPADIILDQFAFKSTGSTTCALIALQHHISCLLEINNYVRCLVIDFSKAFDIIDHAILLGKLTALPIPGNVINWIIDFLTQRQQLCKVGSTLSTPASINRSIIQGSGIGPTLYVVMKSDLKTVCDSNIILKYADDIDLLVPEHSPVDITVELKNVQEWAIKNKMIINLQKTKELVFHRPNPRSLVYPPPVAAIEQVKVAKLLGVFIQSNFCCVEHVNYILAICSQRVYLLRLLAARGLSSFQLHLVCLAIVISRLMYALPAWGGFLSAELRNRINCFLRRLNRYGFTDSLYTIEQLLANADLKLFRKITDNSSHCLYHLLPPEKSEYMQLRPGPHSFQLPLCNYRIYKQSFIVRCLFCRD